MVSNVARPVWKSFTRVGYAEGGGPSANERVVWENFFCQLSAGLKPLKFPSARRKQCSVSIVPMMAHGTGDGMSGSAAMVGSAA